MSDQGLMKCLRCGVTLAFYGQVGYATSTNAMFRADGRMLVNVFVCPECGHLENFLRPEVVHPEEPKD